MLYETNKDKGRAGLSMAIAYFGCNGYTVSVPLNDTQWYDLIIEKDGVFQTVQCKATGTDNNVISLRSCGGTKGTAYDNVKDHPTDWLFCLDNQQNMFLIPMQDLMKTSNTKQITLRTSKTTNGQGFQTYLYKVNM